MVNWMKQVNKPVFEQMGDLASSVDKNAAKKAGFGKKKRRRRG